MQRETSATNWSQIMASGTVPLWCQHPEQRGSICEGQCTTPGSTLWWLSDPSHSPQAPPLYVCTYFPPAGLHPDQHETGAATGCWHCLCVHQVLLSVSAWADLCMHVHTYHTGVLLCVPTGHVFGLAPGWTWGHRAVAGSSLSDFRVGSP